MDIAINVIAIIVLAALSIFLFLTIAGNARRAAFAGGGLLILLANNAQSIKVAPRF